MSKIWLLRVTQYGESSIHSASHDKAKLEVLMSQLASESSALSNAVIERNKRIHQLELENPYQGPEIPIGRIVKEEQLQAWDLYINAREAWIKPILSHANQEVAAKYGLSIETLTETGVCAETEYDLIEVDEV
jgi:hypothetical protein